MKLLSFLFMVSLCACASERPRFKKEKICSDDALRYLQNPRNVEKRALNNPQLTKALANTTKSMQQCYEDFKNRTGSEEFSTCLVVGVNRSGAMEFYNFGSKDIELDRPFLECARAVTQNVSYSSFGSNYVLIQSYQFYVSR